MVRLQPEKMLYLFVAERESQFHYGSITTQRGDFALRSFFWGLNSTMVRLQLKKLYFSTGRFLRLNSTMVRLQLKRS